MCGSEFTLRIIAATVECVALARLLFDQVSVLAVGTLHADEVLLYKLALRISTTRGELAEAAVADHQVASTLGARFVERNVRHLLALIEPARGLAIRVSGAGHKLAEAPALEHHHPAAV